MKSFEAGNSTTIVKMVQDAITNHQKLQFFFYTKYFSNHSLPMSAQVTITNPATGATYTTPWRFGCPFNPDTLSGSARDGNNYCLHYKNDAFRNPFSSYPTNGVIANLASSSVSYLMLAYNYGVQHKQKALGGMLAYIVDTCKTPSISTPYDNS